VQTAVEMPPSLAALPLDVREKAPYLPTAWTGTATATNPLAYEEMSSTGADPRRIRRGRFLSVDPIIDTKRATTTPQLWNRYAYVLNNPINKTDPDGKADTDLRCPPELCSTPEGRAAFREGQTQALKIGGPIVGALVAWEFGVAPLYGTVRGAWRVASGAPSFDNPTSFTGAKPEQLEQSVPENWGPGVPTKKDGGTRWYNPDKRGEGVRIMPGTPGARDPMHAGPYAVFTRNGQEIRVPLAGNPVLQRSVWEKIRDVVVGVFQ